MVTRSMRRVLREHQVGRRANPVWKLLTSSSVEVFMPDTVEA
ncbi:hypothetical protein [Streptomyces canus]|nr:hypothetical protein [Streptomyces canus]MCX4860224.1 hypothetical protein [Streptomyces canus]